MVAIWPELAAIMKLVQQARAQTRLFIFCNRHQHQTQHARDAGRRRYWYGDACKVNSSA